MKVTGPHLLISDIHETKQRENKKFEQRSILFIKKFEIVRRALLLWITLQTLRSFLIGGSQNRVLDFLASGF